MIDEVIPSFGIEFWSWQNHLGAAGRRNACGTFKVDSLAGGGLLFGQSTAMSQLSLSGCVLCGAVPLAWLLPSRINHKP